MRSRRRLPVECQRTLLIEQSLHETHGPNHRNCRSPVLSHEGSDLEIRAMANDVQNRKRLSTTTTGRDKLRDQENALELLEVAMWVALTQYQMGKKFLFEHPADASSWNTEMVSLVTGLKGVMLVTVDLCTLEMVDEDERSY